ncbi:hypothetical protein, partial [Neoroseomonas soli]
MRSPRRQHLVPVLILLSAVLVPALLFVILTLHDKGHERQEVAERVVQASLVGRERTLRLIQLALLSLDRLDDATASLGWPQAQARRTTLQADLHRIEQGLPGPAALMLVRPDGRVAVAGGGEGAAALGEAAALEGLRLPRDGSRGPVFEPMPRDLAARWPGLLVGRPRGQEGRPFDGMLFAALREDALASAWEQAGPGRYALLREDGAVLLR